MQLAGRLERFSDWQVLHLTGRAAYDEVRRAVGEARPNYRVLDYEDDMGRVYAATDLVVARAGAGTVAELTALGLASVLMPYPFHRDRHQERHAQLLERAGAAVMVRDRVKTYGNVDALWRVLPQLLEDDERRRAMAEAARKLGQPKAAKAIAQAVLRAIGW
jgi:UDP-N-acetylglucosamine--N-acetylmuramyl-(pentapeptide) pyrophosphoryl-undecaprenol N-acetylglucosamine transferase